MVTADDEVFKHYFRMLELKQGVVNNVVSQWQLKSRRRALVPRDNTLNSCLIEMLLFHADRSYFSVSLGSSQV